MSHTRKNRNTHNKTKKRTFSKKDYSSGDGMVTKIWGPIFWTAIHTMSFNYPVKPTLKDKKHYRDFIINLQYILPCKYCRMNLTNNFKKKPLQMCHMASRDTFSRYIYNLHELVNRMLKKKSCLTYCDVRERYEHFRSRCTHEKPKLFPNFVKNIEFNKEADISNTSKSEKSSEKGCTEPLYGKKSKCIIKIVPQDNNEATFQMDKKCIKTRE